MMLFSFHTKIVDSGSAMGQINDSTAHAGTSCWISLTWISIAKFHDAAIDVWGWIGNFIRHYIHDGIKVNPC